MYPFILNICHIDFCRYTTSEITYSAGTVYGNRFTGSGSVSSITVNPSAYNTYSWAIEDAEVDRQYDIQAITAACK